MWTFTAALFNHTVEVSYFSTIPFSYYNIATAVSSSVINTSFQKNKP